MNLDVTKVLIVDCLKLYKYQEVFAEREIVIFSLFTIKKSDFDMATKSVNE